MRLTDEEDRRDWRPRIALYVVCSAMIFGLRYKSLHEPLERDHATYAVIAHELLAGRHLYSDLWDNKPPGIFWTYAAGETVFGYGASTVFLLGLLAAVATVPAIERGASAIDPKAGPWAALLWSLTCNDLVIQANQPNAEAFMNLSTAWAFTLLVRQTPGVGGWRRVALAGVLLALGSVYKQVVVFVAVMLALSLALETRSWRRAAVVIAAVGLPGLLAWIAIADVSAMTGSFNDFWMTVFVHSRHYSGDLSTNLLGSVSWARIASVTERPVLIPIGILTACGLFNFRRDALGGTRLLLVAWLVGTHVAVAAPGHFWPHYEQLWLPPLAVGAGWGLARLGRLVGRAGRGAALAPGLAAMVVLLAIESPLITQNAEGYSSSKYGDVFLNVRELGRNLDRLLEPGESFYEWGPEPGLYFYSGKRPLTGVLWDDPLFDSVMSERLSVRTMEELARSCPELVVAYRTDHNAEVDHPILKWVARKYHQLPRSVSKGRHDPEFFVRIGGRLTRQMPALTWEDVMARHAVGTGPDTVSKPKS